MGIARDEFYLRLQNNYRKSPSKSAIFQYISYEHERLVKEAINQSATTTAAVKKSSILQIEYHWEMLLLERESPEEYINHLLHILEKRPVLYQDTTYSTSVEFMVDFISTGLNLGPKEREDLSKSKVKKKLHDKLIELVKNIDSKDKNIKNNIWSRFKEHNYTLKPYTCLRQITETIIERAKNVEIKAFFYDAGYPLISTQFGEVHNKGELSTTNKIISSKRQKKDKTLSLLDIYCKNQDLSLFSDTSYPSANDCDTLFSQLVHSKNHEVLFPLRVDARTGCALYIIGRKYFECLYAEKPNSRRSLEFKQNKNACSYGILSLFEPFIENTNSKGMQYLDHSIGYMLIEGFGIHSSFVEAYENYLEECSEVLVQLIEKNGQYPLKEYPHLFNRYCSLPNLEISVEERMETFREDKEELEEYLKAQDIKHSYKNFNV